VQAETLAASWPGSRPELFGRLGLPDAGTVNTFAASRLAARRGQSIPASACPVAGVCDPRKNRPDRIALTACSSLSQRSG
jgi:hypothetical protein